MREDLTPEDLHPTDLPAEPEAASPTVTRDDEPQPPAEGHDEVFRPPSPVFAADSETMPEGDAEEAQEEQEEGEDEAECPGSAELRDWKQNLRDDFERWLATVEEIPEAEDQDADTEEPDLYSFYGQLTAMGAESRKGNRRTAEAFSQWGDILARLAGEWDSFREPLKRLAALDSRKDELSRAHCLVLVEMFDRMQRVARAFESPPPTRWWRDDSGWQKAWETQEHAFDILLGHLEAFLKKEGVVRIETKLRPFEPAVMTAVAADPDLSRPHHTVIEEIAAGYQRHGELLRPAQVKVSLNPQTS